ncbi:MAG: hypothetical protein AMXMBFR84_18060 [Candidatus Hydrogenedentota bacterium]
MMYRHTIAALLLCLTCAQGFAISDDDVLGLWEAENGGARVQVYKNDNGRYEGKIVWMKEPNYPKGHPDEGKPKTDKANPDKTRHDDPIIGLVLFYGFSFDGKESWNEGSIYDAYHGNTYDSVMSLPAPDTLHVRGYVGLPAFGKTTVWKRVQDNTESGEPSETALPKIEPGE